MLAMQPFLRFLCGCGRAFIQGCQQLCLFLLIAVGVFLAGVFEGVGGARLGQKLAAASVSPRRGGQTSSAVPTARVPGSIQPQLAVGPYHPPPSHPQLFVTLFGERPRVQTSILACSSLRSAHTDRNYFHRNYFHRVSGKCLAHQCEQAKNRCNMVTGKVKSVDRLIWTGFQGKVKE